MRRNDVIYYAGEEPESQIQLFEAYAEISCTFLSTLSEYLRKDTEAKQYPDIQTFSFWCRRANILKYKEEFYKRTEKKQKLYLGRGLFFHIAPSNVPINFAYTLAFGLLSGNANIVRVSEKEFRQVKVICRILSELFCMDQYSVLGRQNAVVTYGHNKALNDTYSKICAGRIVWGGDSTIQLLRESPLQCRSIEIAFGDRYSFAVLHSEAVEALSEQDLHILAERFYNDTYLMDQNACSSPHLILWKGSSRNGRTRFWETVYRVAEKYDLTEKKVMDKLLLLCETAVHQENPVHLEQWGNLLAVLELKEMPDHVEHLRGRFGLFFEYWTQNLAQVFAVMNTKVQTCVYYGVETKELADALLKSNTAGIDRFVPIGKALDISVYWDGFDIIGTMAREISF